MSDSRRVEGERVFCHQCSNEWDRAYGGLTCPNCEGEFVEILSPGETRSPDSDEQRLPASEPPSPPLRPHPFHDHNPWAEAPDPDEGDISSFEFNTIGGGRGTFSYTSRTYRSGGPNGMPQSIFPFSPFGAFGQQQQQGLGRVEGRGGIFPRDTRGQPGPGDMQDLFSMIFQTMQHGGVMGERPAGFTTATFGGGARGSQNAQGPSPFDLLGAILNPTGRQGDAVWSQEAFDLILEQLAEQNQVSTAPGPASEQALKSLSTKKVTDDMMGNDGKAECSICMDNVEVGSTVTELPCKHWFHGDCVVSWLKEHDTCPHCRKPISDPGDQQPASARRLSSRQSSSNANSFGADGSRDRPYRVSDSPGDVRDARNAYYQNSNRSYPNNHRSAYAEAQDQPNLPGQYPSQQMPTRLRRHSSSQSGRHSNSRHNSDRGSGSGSGSSGGVLGRARNFLGMG